MEKYCKYHVLDGAIWTVGWNIIYHRIWIVKRMRLVTGPEAYTNHVSAPIYTRKRADIVLILFFNHVIVHPDFNTSYNQSPSSKLSK